MVKIILIFIAIISLFSCEGEKLDVTSCSPSIVITTTGSETDNIYLRGSFNNWERLPMDYKDGIYSIKLNLRGGEYGYLFESSKKEDWFLDRSNQLTIYLDDFKASRLIVKDCRYPKLKLEEQEITNNSFKFRVKYFPGIEKGDIDFNKSIVTINGIEVNLDFDKDSSSFLIEKKDVPFGKFGYLFKIFDSNGYAADSLYIPIWVEEKKFNWKDAIIYQIMTDRFVDGDSNNSIPIVDPIYNVDKKANWQGGDFKGIIDKLDSNYFTDLGINVIWISSPILNTTNAGKGMGGDSRYYAPYHSYWPIATGWSDFTPIKDEDGNIISPIEPHFGDKELLISLINKAHQKGIRVLFDIIPNHVHTQSNMWEEHNSYGWFHLEKDGNPYICGWERPIECWFNHYLADINHKNIDATNYVTNHLIWLAKEFNIDGFRVDAVRLMIIDFTKNLNYFIKKELELTGVKFYTIGETFTGELENSTAFDTIGYYLGENSLDGQFNFPMFHEISKAFLLNNQSFLDFNNFLINYEYKFQTYYTNALMGNFIGNHDICRAISVANGDFDNSTQGGDLANSRVWQDEPTVPIDNIAFKKLTLAHTFLLTTPSPVIIYQGDEFGMPGANDPDNRRMMIFDDKLSLLQKNTLKKFKKLTKFRNKNLAIRYGKRDTLFIEDNIWFYTMSYKDNKILVGLNKSNEDKIISLDIIGNQLIDLDNNSKDINNNKIDIELNSFDIFVAEIK